MLYPFQFVPRVKERVWGGRRLADLFGKSVVGVDAAGESWEVSDRPGDESVIANGPLAGRTLRWLMENHGDELCGRPTKIGERFPWLAKILDARDDLSLQVHPPAELASKLAGEPKTEIWHIAAADPGAVIYVGLKRGVTRGEFERRIGDGTVADCFHRVPVQAGDTMFLPSGRVHALGKGIALFEVQQNSDTTFRVFDWNRVGLDGKPRALHVPQSLASIDFDDFEPNLVHSEWSSLAPGIAIRSLAQHSAFNIFLLSLEPDSSHRFGPGKLRMVACVAGAIRCETPEFAGQIKYGEFMLLPASLEIELKSVGTTRILVVEES